MTVIRCGSEAEWLTERQKSLGGSDVPALFGLGFKSAFRVALEKLGKAPSQATTEDMEMGLLLEPVIRTLYQRRTKRTVGYPGQHVIFRHDHGFMHATLDGNIDDHEQYGHGEYGVLQCKMSNEPPSEWEEGSPLRLALEVQLSHEMICTGARFGSGAVLCTHFRQQFITFDVTRNDDFCGKLIEKERRFWEEIHNGILPDPTSADDDHRLIRQLHPEANGKPVVLSDPRFAIMFEEYDLANRQRKEAEDRELRAKNGLELAIGDARGAVLANGVQLSLRSTKDGRRVLKREWVRR